jgi:hypothetical protein
MVIFGGFYIAQALDCVIRGRDRVRVPKPIHFARSLAVALMVAVMVTAFATVAHAADGFFVIRSLRKILRAIPGKRFRQQPSLA